MKFNMGCGDDIREGYMNVDFRKTHPDVLVADLSIFPWPVESNVGDEILLLDFLEHFQYAYTAAILMECYRILKPGAELVIQVPDAVHLGRALAKDGDYLCNRCGGFMLSNDSLARQLQACPDCEQSADDIATAAMMRLYGGQNYPGNFHQTCFTKDMLVNIAVDCGFGLLRFEEQAHMWLNWNLKARFKRVDLW